MGLDGATAEGWTLFHKAALHQCPQCGARLLAAATRKPKVQIKPLFHGVWLGLKGGKDFFFFVRWLIIVNENEYH